MDSRQLHYFRAVVDTGSFTKAAEAMGLTQPSLSLSMRKLEDDLGAQLLNRSRAGVTPTKAGSYLYQIASRMDSLFDDAKRRVSDINAGVYGTVRLASSPVFNWDFIPEVIDHMISENPTIDISLDDPRPSQAVQDVQLNKADVGVIIVNEYDAFAAFYEEDLAIEPLARLEFRLAVPDRLRDLPEPVSLKDLVAETFILPYSGQHFTDLAPMMENIWRTDPTTKPARTIQVSTMHAAIPLVAGGVGVAIMTENSRHLAGDLVTLKRIAEPLPLATAIAFHHTQRNLSPAAQHLLEVILKVGSQGVIR